MDVKLYSTNCPKCKALEKQLNKSKIEYELITDTKIMMDKGFTSAPKLEVDNKIMNYPDALRWAMNGGK